MKLGQVRRWGVLPQPAWMASVPHPANGKRFLVVRVEDEPYTCKGEYIDDDGRAAGFTVARRSFFEAYSTGEDAD